ncbi:Holliday junction branch migration protein RuvA [Actinopolyspora mortivallis]|uniref:Holliday junction branch migration complex subunit RuvA n=1 Tax=Actinopolyspora mortivallis TaxID=33906 RepID=A0A2T0H1A6_ACTMO|nr:Holliday junction branch migration protein RuvA [Actinopolyspora mortivallis]PRW65146.1 Holliday junction branch migration protein RuvA [Actinopolyspora mortivallis]
MIASVRGEVLSVGLDHAVVEVGGVGMAVHATPATLGGLRQGEQARLATSLVVREDSLTLYGFADARARDLFTMLQTASGVGPRLALAALAVLEPDQLRTALAEGDIGVLTRVPGIGRKNAERLTLELRDKVNALPSPDGTAEFEASVTSAATGTAGPSPTTARLRSEVSEALVGLGFSVKQAEQSVNTVLAEAGEHPPDTSTLLRRALAALGPT